MELGTSGLLPPENGECLKIVTEGKSLNRLTPKLIKAHLASYLKHFTFWQSKLGFLFFSKDYVLKKS